MHLLSANNSYFSILLQWDKQLFIRINSQWVNPFFDWLMPIVREPAIWIPLYILLLIFSFYKMGWRHAIPWLLLAAFAPTFGDIISSHGIKEYVGRVRPCNEPSLQYYFRDILHHCGANGSFTSSHAVNHFAMAMYLAVTLKPYLKNARFLFFFWAALICYAQVYVGVHYPGDVLGGALLGCIIGGLLGFLFNKKF